MARAIAHLICHYCGKEFEKTKDCRNRKEADSWVEWMESQSDCCCGSCWYKNKIAEEKEADLQAKVRLGSPYNLEREIWFVLFGDTYPIKNKLKEIGAKWTDTYPGEISGFAGGLFCNLIDMPQLKRWAICCNMDDKVGVQKVADQLQKLGITIEEIDQMTLSTWVAIRCKFERQREEEERLEAEKEEKIESEIAKLGPIPTWPESFPPAKGRWNGTVYGKKGNRSVYIDGTKYTIDDELAEQVELVLKERDAWRAKKNEIQNKYR